MKNWLHDIELKGNNILLIPMNMTHKNALVEAASDGKLWKLWFTSVPSEKTIEDYILKAIKQRESGEGYPFVVINKKTNQIIGSTRYCNATPENRRLEIGYTWYASKHQRTGVNTECKYLLLKYAFETLNCIAVEFKTNWYNIKSKEAITRLGAKLDGVLRNHRISPDGSLRDTVIYSIINQEWHSVKKSLTYKMSKYND